MSEPHNLPESRPASPEGFRYQPDLLTADEESRLLAAIPQLPFADFEFHGYVGKRRTVSFGWSYDFSTGRLSRASELPAFMEGLRQAAGAFAGVAAERLEQVLVTEYGPGAGIGWHRDKAVFGDVIGVSLLAPCRFRLRRQQGGRWERVTVRVEPRSAYLLSGPARHGWEHSIPDVETRRYSVTFRTLALRAEPGND